MPLTGNEKDGAGMSGLLGSFFSLIESVLLLLLAIVVIVLALIFIDSTFLVFLAFFAVAFFFTGVLVLLKRGQQADRLPVVLEVESQTALKDEARFALEAAAPGQDRALLQAMIKKAGYLLKHQMNRVVGEGENNDYQMRLTANVFSKRAWKLKRGETPNPQDGGIFVHLLLMEVWGDGQMLWRVTAGLERHHSYLETQLDLLFSAIFDCFGRGLVQDGEEMLTHGHEYLRLLKDEFGPA
jgi:hypothetical protein